MFYRGPMTPAAIGIALVLTFTTASATELDKSANDQEIIVAQSAHHEEYKSANTKHLKEKSCHHKKNDGKKEHRSSGFKHGAGHSYAHMIATHADELNLSDAQLGRFVRFHMKHSQEHKEFKRKIHQSMKNFHHAGMNPGTDDATLRKLGNEHVETFKAMLEQHIRSSNVANAILTAEQREQLKTMEMNHVDNSEQHGSHKDKHSSKHSHRYY